VIAYQYSTFQCELPQPHVLLVTLNRPEVRNAFNTQMGHDLLDLWTRLTVDPGDARSVVVTGAGDQAFCAGAYLKERKGMTQEAWHAQHELFERASWTLGDLPLPMIAAEVVPEPVRENSLELVYGQELE
jgi:enoyl-CoA hydratase/carnithine racemase